MQCSRLLVGPSRSGATFLKICSRDRLQDCEQHGRCCEEQEPRPTDSSEAQRQQQVLEPGGEATLSGCDRVVGIRPTGWTWRQPKKGGARDKAMAENEDDLCSALVSSYSPVPGVTVAGVPYSVRRRVFFF